MQKRFWNLHLNLFILYFRLVRVKTSDVSFSMYKGSCGGAYPTIMACSPLGRGAGGVLGRTQLCLTYNLRFTNYDLNPKS